MRRVEEKKHFGGSAWESNPPIALLRRYTGFEVQEGHQCPIHFRPSQQYSQLSDECREKIPAPLDYPAPETHPGIIAHPLIP